MRSLSVAYRCPLVSAWYHFLETLLTPQASGERHPLRRSHAGVSRPADSSAITALRLVDVLPASRSVARLAASSSLLDARASSLVAATSVLQLPSIRPATRRAHATYQGRPRP